jgi:hypothetical protein
MRIPVIEFDIDNIDNLTEKEIKNIIKIQK